jgi:hypothetical protein
MTDAIREIACRCVAVFAISITGCLIWPSWTRLWGSCYAKDVRE